MGRLAYLQQPFSRGLEFITEYLTTTILRDFAEFIAEFITGVFSQIGFPKTNSLQPFYSSSKNGGFIAYTLGPQPLDRGDFPRLLLYF